MENRFSQGCCCSTAICDICQYNDCAFTSRFGQWSLVGDTWAGIDDPGSGTAGIAWPYTVAALPTTYSLGSKMNIKIVFVFIAPGVAYVTLDDETDIGGSPIIDNRYSYLGIELEAVPGTSSVYQVYLAGGWNTSAIGAAPSFNQNIRALIGCVSSEISVSVPLKITAYVMPNALSSHKIVVPLFNAETLIPAANPSGRVSNKNTFGFLNNFSLPKFEALDVNYNCANIPSCECAPAAPAACITRCVQPRTPYPTTISVTFPVITHSGPTCPELCTNWSTSTFVLPYVGNFQCALYQLDNIFPRIGCATSCSIIYELRIHKLTVSLMIPGYGAAEWKWQGAAVEIDQNYRECLCYIRTHPLFLLSKDPIIKCNTAGVPVLNLPAGYTY